MRQERKENIVDIFESEVWKLVVHFILAIFTVTVAGFLMRRSQHQVEKEYAKKYQEEAEMKVLPSEMLEKITQIRPRLQVCIREKNWTKTPFEATYIDILLDAGVGIVLISEKEVRAIRQGDYSHLRNGHYVLVAVWWPEERVVQVQPTSWMEEGIGHVHHCDWSLYTADDSGNVSVIRSGCTEKTISLSGEYMPQLLADVGTDPDLNTRILAISVAERVLSTLLNDRPE